MAEIIPKGTNREFYRIGRLVFRHRCGRCRLATPPFECDMCGARSEKLPCGQGERQVGVTPVEPYSHKGEEVGKSLLPSSKGGRPKKTLAERRQTKRNYQRAYRAAPRD